MGWVYPQKNATFDHGTYLVSLFRYGWMVKYHVFLLKHVEAEALLQPMFFVSENLNRLPKCRRFKELKNNLSPLKWSEKNEQIHIF